MPHSVKSSTPILAGNPESSTFETPMDLQTSIFNLPHRETPHPEHIAGSVSLMGQEMRVLVKKIQDLRHLGIEDSKIALPKICVVGDQSTGKSSLIEGMSEIKVPRSAGTCTRCPLEINLSESNANQPWTCTISLHRSYIFDGQKKIKKIGKSHPLGPWVPQDPEEELFAVLHDKDMVQEALECAQLAILNPQDDPRRFAPGTVSALESRYTSVKFSPNVVRIDISAPGFPNLAFYDLPGVISQAEVDEEAFLVTLVENLVKHYVSQDNCIVLLTLPMTDDATNSSAARIVRGIKATHRTLGVLTKPDRVEDIAQWIEILRGDKFALGHGYFVIRNNPDPGVAHQQARMEEAQFFASPLWMDHLGCFQSRFGTRNLQTTLSRLLLSQIQESLPSVIQQINEKAERVDAELSQLPEPLAQNTLWRLYSSLSELKDRIRLCIDGGSTNLPMRKIWFNIAKDFSSTISRTRPSINLRAEKEEFAPDNEEAASNSDCEVTFTRTVKRKTLDAKAPASAIKQPTVSTNDDFTDHFKDYCAPGKTFELEEIRNMKEDASGGGLQEQSHPKAIEQMSRLSVQHWKESMKVFLAVSHRLVRQTFMEQIEKVFSCYTTTELYRQLTKIVDQFFSEVRSGLDIQALKLYELEHSMPFTMDQFFMNRAFEENLGYLKARRRILRARSLLQSRGTPLSDNTVKAEKEIHKVTDQELGRDHFAAEIQMMSRVRGYYQVASSRFVDSLCQTVHIQMFAKCREQLFPTIERKLGIMESDAMDRCAQLMADDPERQRRRLHLVKERTKLTTAQQWLAAAGKAESDTMDCNDDSRSDRMGSYDEDDKSRVAV